MAMCLSPISIKRPNSNNPQDRVSVRCGKCLACKSARSNEWIVRLNDELRFMDYGSAYFVTLTYDENHNLGVINKRHVQLFLKKLRKANVEKLKYYAVGEYGTNTGRPHYHGSFYYITSPDIFQKCWEHGNVYVVPMNGSTNNYVSKHNLKATINGTETFSLMSQGLGIKYVNTKRKYLVRRDDLCHIDEFGVKKRYPVITKKRFSVKKMLVLLFAKRLQWNNTSKTILITVERLRSTIRKFISKELKSILLKNLNFNL